MYDHAHPAALGARDVIAAWLICFAVAIAVFVQPGFFAEPARKSQTALKTLTPTAPRAELCAVRSRQIGEKHG